MKTRPNILWIVTTQWRSTATGYAGDPNARTLHLDALAKESINFEQAVTPHPFGPFARAAMLTGQFSPENGIRDYFDSLPVNARTIAHELGEEGYVTAFFGKWHLGRRNPEAALVGEEHAKTIIEADQRGGFEFWEGFESGFLLNDPWLHGSRLPEPEKFPGYQSDVLCERAGAWLRKRNQQEQPWFSMVSLEAPHPPYDVPTSGIRPGKPEAISLSPNVPLGEGVESKARRELAGYYAHIEATDRAIGALVDQVKNFAPNTVVIFTSVHGDMHGAHGLFRKGWPYEESVRVPLLIRLPEGIAGISGAAISLVDLPVMMRTYLKSGQLITREAGEAVISMPSVVKLSHQGDRIWRGVRSPQRKLILNEDGSPWLFFDLEADPWEQHNLVSDPARRAELSGWMRRIK